ncbi:hypothetical protein D3C73_1646720 [compost metagenome]
MFVHTFGNDIRQVGYFADLKTVDHTGFHGQFAHAAVHPDCINHRGSFLLLQFGKIDS